MDKGKQGIKFPWPGSGLRLGDLAVFLVYVVVAVWFSVQAWAMARGQAQLRIETPEGTYEYSLEESLRIEVQGSQGPSIIEIRDGEVWFEDSPCRDKLCVHAGHLSQAGQWAACLPNRVFVSIQGTQAADVPDAATW